MAQPHRQPALPAARDRRTPARCEELVALVRRAEQESTTVRARRRGPRVVGRRADRRLPRSSPTGSAACSSSTTGRCATAAAGPPLVRVLGGTPLRALNAALDREGLALPNMGGYDAQTITGVVSTSTHGSGLRWGPFPDLVRSLDLVVSGGEVVRVEPRRRPHRSRALRRRPRRRAAPDPGRRHLLAPPCAASACSASIHSLVLEVREKFWLNEVRTVSTWEAVTRHADRRTACSARATTTSCSSTPTPARTASTACS